MLSSAADDVDDDNQQQGMGSGNNNGDCCGVYHLRDSPFCHLHKSLDPGADQKKRAGGTSELEDTLNVLIEEAIDHAPPPELGIQAALAAGKVARASLPEKLQGEFPDPLECFQLRCQFDRVSF
jgi:hypothetical protein